MTDHTAENDAPLWEVRPGDRFLPYAVTIWMNEHDHGFNYRVLDHAATTLPRAIKRGLAMSGSDDFNIAAIRDGRMVAALWMEGIVDDDPLVVDEIADALGLTRVLPPVDLCPEFVDTGRCGHSDAEHDALADAPNPPAKTERGQS